MGGSLRGNGAACPLNFEKKGMSQKVGFTDDEVSGRTRLCASRGERGEETSRSLHRY
jgi:hypothetical protein